MYLENQWDGHHTSIHQDDKDGNKYVAVQVDSNICFSEDQSNNKIILCTNETQGFKILDFTECYHIPQKLSIRLGTEKRNGYFHQGFVYHDIDCVGYTMMFYNRSGVGFDEERKIKLAAVLCGLDQMYETVCKNDPEIEKYSCLEIVQSLRKKITRKWTIKPKPPLKPKPESHLEGKLDATNTNKKRKISYEIKTI